VFLNDADDFLFNTAKYNASLEVTLSKKSREYSWYRIGTARFCTTLVLEMYPPCTDPGLVRTPSLPCTEHLLGVVHGPVLPPYLNCTFINHVLDLYSQCTVLRTAPVPDLYLCLFSSSRTHSVPQFAP